ncbi:MAG: hypothetical protein OSB55_01020 [Verrucomicrobiota bacterium]|nr:hypothetical protein [Verrucomicrobiota bacterium]
MNISLDKLSVFGREVFRQAGLSQADAATATDTLLAADSRGIHTYGLEEPRQLCETAKRRGGQPA